MYLFIILSQMRLPFSRKAFVYSLLSLACSLSFAQSGYNVRLYGAKGDGQTDDTAAIQKTINLAKGAPVYLPAGRYRISAPLTYHTSGDVAGLKLVGDGQLATYILPNFSNGAAIDIDGRNVLYSFQYGASIRDLSILGIGHTSGADGIRILGAWQTEVTNVSIQGMSGDAIVFPARTDLGNVDGWNSAFAKIEGCSIRFNIGWGIRLNSSAGSAITVERNTIGDNQAGGLYLDSWHARVVNNSFMMNGSTSDASSGGIAVDYAATGGGSPEDIVIEDNEFETNYNYHIWVKAADSLTIQRNKINSHAANGVLTPSAGIVLCGIGKPVRFFDIQKDIYESAKTGSYTAILFKNAQCVLQGTIAKEIFYTSWNTPSLVKYGLVNSSGTIVSTLPATITSNVTFQ